MEMGGFQLGWDWTSRARASLRKASDGVARAGEQPHTTHGAFRKA